LTRNEAVPIVRNGVKRLLQVGLVSLAIAFLQNAFAQDLRNVTEPAIPQACATLFGNLSGTTEPVAAGSPPVSGLDEGRSGPVPLIAGLSSEKEKLRDEDERKLDTARIQQALDSCPAGRAVELKGGDGVNQGRNAFLSGPLDLRRGVTLLVDAGVTLFASRDPRVYDTQAGRCGTVDQAGRGCRALINGTQVEGAGVMGDGAIDGRGGEKLLGQTVTWWDLAEQARAGGAQNAVRLIVLSRCDNFTLYRITLRNLPNFHVAYNNGNGFTVWGVHIDAPKNARNTDGIDPGNSTNVTIAHSYIRAGDDNVAIKAGAGNPTTHMTIAHNHFYYGHGMSIGSETNGGASAIRVTDLSIDGADNGIRIKSNSTWGGLVRDISYEDVCIRATKNPILMDTHYSGNGPTGTGDRIPVFQDIVLRNVWISGPGKITLDGFDAAHRLGLTFDGVVLNPLGSIQIAAQHMELGPGPVNFVPSGEDVLITGKGSESPGRGCEDKFVPYPAK
jgi:polygalacturonase